MPAVSLTNYLIDALLNDLFKATPYTPPGTTYVGLFTTTLAAAGTGTEASWGSYARKAVSYGAITSHALTNSAAITFDTVTSGSATVLAIGLMDALTSGNMLEFYNLPVGIAVATGSTPQIASGALSVDFT